MNAKTKTKQESKPTATEPNEPVLDLVQSLMQGKPDRHLYFVLKNDDYIYFRGETIRKKNGSGGPTPEIIVITVPAAQGSAPDKVGAPQPTLQRYAVDDSELWETLVYHMKFGALAATVPDLRQVVTRPCVKLKPDGGIDFEAEKRAEVKSSIWGDFSHWVPKVKKDANDEFSVGGGDAPSGP